jgi:hypothetical protein
MSTLELEERTSMNEIEIKTVYVNPEMAQDLLTHYNPKNRPIRKIRVDAYARDMRAGKWLVNGETVKFDWNGNLADGQHRLLAIVQSGVTVPLTIVTGVDPDAWGTVDAGVAKTAADMLANKGVPNAALQASVARLALVLNEGMAEGRVSGSKVTNTEVGEYLEDHPEISESVHRTEQARKLIKGCRPSLMVYADTKFAEIDPNAAANFWHAAAELVADFDGDPAVTVARRFADLYVQRVNLADLQALDVLYRAWNKRRRRQALRTVKVLPVKDVTELPRLR